MDIVTVLTDQDDYTKTRNYWKYLKAKLKKDKNELVSLTSQLKLQTADGKKYKTDVLDSDVVILPGKFDKRIFQKVVFNLCFSVFRRNIEAN